MQRDRKTSAESHLLPRAWCGAAVAAGVPESQSVSRPRRYFFNAFELQITFATVNYGHERMTILVRFEPKNSTVNH